MRRRTLPLCQILRGVGKVLANLNSLVGKELHYGKSVLCRLCLRMAVFPLKRVDSSVDLQRMPCCTPHVNRVTFSLTSTLPMANPGCPVCSHRGGMAGSSA